MRGASHFLLWVLVPLSTAVSNVLANIADCLPVLHFAIYFRQTCKFSTFRYKYGGMSLAFELCKSVPMRELPANAAARIGGLPGYLPSRKLVRGSADVALPQGGPLLLITPELARITNFLAKNFAEFFNLKLSAKIFNLGISRRTLSLWKSATERF